MMQEVEVLKTIPELVCSYFSEEQFTLSFGFFLLHFVWKSAIVKSLRTGELIRASDELGFEETR